MYEYHLNIALVGLHVCNVVFPAGTDIEKARKLAQDFQMRFPATEGFALTLTALGTTGNDITF